MESATGTKSAFATPWTQLIIGLSASPDLLTHFNAGMCTPQQYPVAATRSSKKMADPPGTRASACLTDTGSTQN